MNQNEPSHLLLVLIDFYKSWELVHSRLAMTECQTGRFGRAVVEDCFFFGAWCLGRELGRPAEGGAKIGKRS
jgi:hypothetical protein